jgi:lipopolysaccharide export system permease protein
MGKTLGKYFFVEIGGSFLSGLVLFTFILFLARVLGLVEMIFARGVPAAQVGALFLYIIPTFLEVTVPMALLLAVVAAFGRLASDGELTGLRAAGVNIYQMLVPVLVFAVCVAGLTLCLAVWARPWGTARMHQAIYEMAKTRATAALRPRVFNTDYEDLVIYVDQVDPESGILKGVMLADEREGYRRTTVFADSGRILGDDATESIYLHLIDGTSVSVYTREESWDWTDFRSLEVNLDVGTQTPGATADRGDPRQMTLQQLNAARSSPDPELAVGVDLEIHRKLAVTVAALLLAILGVPLGMQPSRSFRARGVGVSIAVILIYYVLLSAGDGLARQGLAQAAVAMWLPNVLLAMSAGWMFHRAATERLFYPSGFSRLRLMWSRSTPTSGDNES